MGAAPAYQYYPERNPQRSPHVRVVPGGAPHRAPEAQPSSVRGLAILTIAALVLASALAFTRVGFSVAAVVTEIESSEISSNIESAQDTGNDLEVRQAYLSNLANVRQEAAQLGMEAAEETTTIVLEQDVVTSDSAGNLSLALSVATASELATSANSEDTTDVSSEATDTEGVDDADTGSATATDTSSAEGSSTAEQSAAS